MSCPSAIGVRSTSIGAPAAIVEASGFIWDTNGQSVNSPPTAAAAPVATKRKSRRVEWSAELAAVVTIPYPFLAAAGGTAPGDAREYGPANTTPARTNLGGCRRPRPRGGRSTASSSRSGETSNPESFDWHPCRTSASPVSASQCAMHEIRTDRCFIPTSLPGRHGMQIALFQPDIPPNTGTILRLCACLDVTAHIIEPAGFPVSDRAFRRAGMDYLDRVAIMRHDSWPKFEQCVTKPVAGWCCSRPKVAFPTLIFATMWPTSCCSGVNPQGFLTRSPPPPTPGW